MKDIRIVFMGTPLFAVPIFNALAENYNVVAVVTQPDKLVGRKQILTPSPIKKASALYNIPVLQPVKIRDEYEKVLKYKPDMIVTCAYGQILPKELLDYPKYKCINVHASLLPKLRGGAPIHHAIMDGYDKTGITIMYMAKKMDAGDMIAQKETPILEEDTVGILYDRLSDLGAKLLKETLPDILKGTNQRIPQDENLVTYAPTLSREDERLDWNMSARQVYNKVRGTNPWPGSYTTYQGKTVKIWAGQVHQCENAMKHHAHQDNGTIVKIFKDAIGVKVNDGVYLITELQLEGKKRMSVKDYLNGHCIFEVNTKFE